MHQVLVSKLRVFLCELAEGGRRGSGSKLVGMHTVHILTFVREGGRGMANPTGHQSTAQAAIVEPGRDSSEAGWQGMHKGFGQRCT